MAAPSPTGMRSHELFQMRHAFDGAAAPTLFRGGSERLDPVSRRVLGLKVAGGVRMDVFVRCRPLTTAEEASLEPVVVQVNEKKKSVTLR